MHPDAYLLLPGREEFNYVSLVLSGSDVRRKGAPQAAGYWPKVEREMIDHWHHGLRFLGAWVP